MAGDGRGDKTVSTRSRGPGFGCKGLETGFMFHLMTWNANMPRRAVTADDDDAVLVLFIIQARVSVYVTRNT